MLVSWACKFNAFNSQMSNVSLAMYASRRPFSCHGSSSQSEDATKLMNYSCRVSLTVIPSLFVERGAQLANNNSNVGSSRRKSPFPRPRMKRPASEMDTEAYLNDENLKRSKLVAALTQFRRPPFFNHAPAAFNQRREHAVASCGTWEPPSLHHQQATVTEHPGPILPAHAVQQQTPMAHRPLPDLSKDLSILPALNDCSTTSTPPPSSADDVASCSSIGSAASWTGMPNNPDQTIPNGTYDGCDPGWLGTPAEESYDANGWTKLAKVGPSCISTDHIQPNSQNGATLNNSHSNYGNVSAPSNQEMANQPAAGYYVDQPNTSVYNGSHTNAEVYRPDDFMTSTPTSGSNFSDFVYVPPPPCQNHVETCQSINQKLNPNWSNPSPSQSNHQPLQIHHHHHHHRQLPTPLPIAVMTSRLWFDCYDANCYHKNSPLFRIQRPGNPSSLFVASGRSFTLPTFCNMLPRVTSFIQ